MPISFASFNLRRSSRYLLFFILIGIIAGLGSVAFQFLCDVGMHYFMDMLAGFRPGGPHGEVSLFSYTDTPLNKWMLIVIPTVGGLVSGWLVYTFAPEAEGHGTDAAIEAYHKKDGLIRPQVPLVKTLASAVTLTSGGSGGREGPIAQIGAGFGSYLATRLKLSPVDRRVMMAAGIGAGVGSIFRAPLAGALFAAEVLYADPDFEAEVLIPSGISSVVAYCIFCLIYGWGSLFHSSPYFFKNPLELGPYTILALILSGVSFLYVRCFYLVHDFFKDMKIPPIIKPAIGGFLTGIIGFFLPQTLSFGYGVLQEALFNKLGIALLLAIAFGKILTTSFSIGSGGSGGVFGPSIVIGGCIGGACGILFHNFMPHVITTPQAMVILGMAGFFTAVSNAPISTIIFVSEMTNSYQLLLPSFLVCLLCYNFSKRWTIYREQVKNKAASPAHAGEFFFDILKSYKVSDIKDVIQQVEVVPEDMSFADFKRFFCNTNQHYFPVVNKEGKLVGIFSNTDFRCVLFVPEIEHLVIVKDIATTQIISTNLREDLHTVMKKFTIKNLESLPVVDLRDSQRLLGMLRRREVISFYNQKVEEIAGSHNSKSSSG